MGYVNTAQTTAIIEATAEAIEVNQPKKEPITDQIFVGVAIALIVTILTWLWRKK